MAIDTISLGYNTCKMYNATMLKNACIDILRELDLRYKMYGYLTLEQWHLYNYCLSLKKITNWRTMAKRFRNICRFMFSIGRIS